MQTFNISRKVTLNPQLTDKAVRLMRMFGLDMRKLRKNQYNHNCDVELRDGDICYITGASGSGKSILLDEMYNSTEEDKRIRLDDIELNRDKSLIDCIDCDLVEGLSILGKVGLSDVFSMLNQPINLSEGQKYRYRLARALVSNKKIIFADEFCSNLDRITAALIAHKIRRLAKDTYRTFILASSHEDILCDLRPDIIIMKKINKETEVIYRDIRRQNDRRKCLFSIELNND